MNRAAALPKVRGPARGRIGPAIALTLIGLLGGYMVIGPTGLFAWGDYNRRLVAERAELKALQAREATLQRRVDLLDPRHADPDLAEELIRRGLGVAHPDDIIVPLR